MSWFTKSPLSHSIPSQKGFFFWEGSTLKREVKYGQKLGVSMVRYARVRREERRIKKMEEKDAGVKWFNTVYYPLTKKARAVRYEDGVLPRLRERVITFFTPWGFRYNYQEQDINIDKGDREVQLLEFFAEMLKEFQANILDREWRWLFLAADSYAARINGESKEVVYEYFELLYGWFREIMPEKKVTALAKWSRYDDTVAAVEFRKAVENNFDRYVSQTAFKRAVSTALKMGKTEEAAKAYCIERATEALWVEGALHPIKISAVRRDRDDGLDVALPRIYLLPEYLQAPWL